MNRDAQLSALASQSGYEEGDNNENDFTKWQTDGEWSGAAWCDSFAQWGAVLHGGFTWEDWCQWGPHGDAYVPYTRKHAMDLGLWRDKGWTPEPGWQVCFDWNGDGVADHIGTVWDARSYPHGSLVTIEGNTGNGVVKYCLRDSSYIMGFVAIPNDGQEYQPPTQEEIVAPDNPSSEELGKVSWPVLSVRTGASQHLYTLAVQGLTNADRDGDFGSQTRSQVINFQRTNGLQFDGVVGNITATALVQAGLNFIGINCGAVDGSCGPQTTAGIKQFQANCGITVDGEFGQESTQALVNLAGY